MADMPKRQHLTILSPDPRADEAQLRDAILSKLTYDLGKSTDSATDYDWYQATALACAIALSTSGWQRAPRRRG